MTPPSRKQRRNRNYIQKPLRITQQQWRALDDKAYALGVPPMVLARNLLADALNVPRDTLLKNLQDSFLDIDK